MQYLKAEQAPRFEVPGVEFTGMAAPSRGSKDICTWRITVAPNRPGDDSHVLDRDEIFMVTKGQLEVSGQLLGPGDALVVPAGEPIAVGNPGAEPAEAIVVIAAGFSAVMADGSRLQPPWSR